MMPGAFLAERLAPTLAPGGDPLPQAHTLRHTYASLLIQNGESLAYIRDQLGHHSIKLKGRTG
jgi:integrase